MVGPARANFFHFRAPRLAAAQALAGATAAARRAASAASASSTTGDIEMSEAFLCDAIRTPIGRYAGSLSSVRADDLGAVPLKALIERNKEVDWNAVDDVIYGCANQAGEDNRNVARMSLLLAGLPQGVPGSTVNRLCGSGMDAVGIAARALKAGEAGLMIAGGVESMSRAPFVMGKATTAFARQADIFDTTIGWRFINPLMKQMYGVDSMPETGENVAQEFGVSRADQDAFALRSQQNAARAQRDGTLAQEIVPVTVPQKKGDPLAVSSDEHPRETSLEALAKLKGVVRADGTVTAGNASGVNDGAAALLLANEAIAKRFGLTPRARVLGVATAGVAPRVMGIGPAPATQKLLARLGMKLDQFDVIELNEAFASQGLAVLRMLGVADDDPRVNPNGGAIALGHPLGMSGARLVTTAMYQLQRTQGRFALCTMCIGVGQGIAIALERV
jgi:3-oxoadipyl-CoA thiolase